VRRALRGVAERDDFPILSELSADSLRLVSEESICRRLRAEIEKGYRPGPGGEYVSHYFKIRDRYLVNVSWHTDYDSDGPLVLEGPDALHVFDLEFQLLGNYII
jgi:hypothetical protein